MQILLELRETLHVRHAEAAVCVCVCSMCVCSVCV